MATVFLLFGLFVLAALLFGGNEKPRELSPDIWVPDPEERAERLKAATAAWYRGQGASIYPVKRRAWVAALFLLGAAIFVPEPLHGAFALLGALALLFWLAPNKPGESDPDIYVRDDPEETAARLFAATAAWRKGRIWTPPEKLAAQSRYFGPLPAVADPNGAAPARRLVRCCALHRPRWE